MVARSELSMKGLLGTAKSFVLQLLLLISLGVTLWGAGNVCSNENGTFFCRYFNGNVNFGGCHKP